MNIFIIEDNKEFIKLMERAITQYRFNNDTKINIAYKGEDLSEIINLINPDEQNLFFVDLNLSHGNNGIDFAKKIREIDYSGNIAFLTGLNDKAFEVLSSNIKPLTYIVKKGYEEMKKQINEVIRITSEEKFVKKIKKEIYAIKSGKRSKRIDIDNILYFHTKHRKIELVLENETIQYYDSINKIEKELEEMFGNSFARCHKSIIVNIRKIKEISYPRIELKNGQIIDITRTYRENVERKLLNQEV